MADSMPPPTVTFTVEGTGQTASCECGWLRWFAGPKNARETGAAHVASCKGAPVKREVAKPKRSSSDWSGREGSTWIDKL